MSHDQNSYKSIFKATSIFGGGQIFVIIVNVIKHKIIAMLLGPEGTGLFGNLNAAIDLVKTSTSLGIGQSAVRDISQAATTGDQLHISSTIKTLRRWMYTMGTIGVVITILLSAQLSQWTFGNMSYTWSFICLSIVCLFFAIHSANTATMQGLRQISNMTKAIMLGALGGLIVSIPLLYIFRDKGIVLSIVLTALINLLFSRHFVRKIKTTPVQQTALESYHNGLRMAKLGVMLMLNTLMTVVASYILRAYISRTGGVAEAGIYQSGYAIIEGYFGLIFAAMASDYFPRLSAVHNDNTQVREVVNRQAEVGLLIAFPMIVISLFIMPLLIVILYSGEFTRAVPYIDWAILGNIFKIGSWAMGFILLAKGKSNIFIWTGLIFNSIFLFNNIIGYKYLRIEGIGIAYCLNYIIHFIGLFIVCNRLYGFRYNTGVWKTIIIITSVCALSFCTKYVNNIYFTYIIATFAILFSLLYSFKKLDKQIFIREYIKSKFKNKR